jgi:hypothetical protein
VVGDADDEVFELLLQEARPKLRASVPAAMTMLAFREFKNSMEAHSFSLVSS